MFHSLSAPFWRVSGVAKPALFAAIVTATAIGLIYLIYFVTRPK
jgi:hypothetical protein